jgi:hypothetical protein
MIYETVMYGIRCNRCREALENSEGYSLFVDRHDADEEAQENDWQSFDGEKHYCPSCVKYNEDKGEYEPLPPIPPTIWEARRFLAACYGKYETVVTLLEDEECFKLKMYIPERGELRDMAVVGLNRFLGEGKYRVEHEKTTGYNLCVYIVIPK